MADAERAIRPARSVRYRLLAIALLPMLVILPLLLGVTVYRWNEKFDATLISKVNGDLTIAHQYLAHILDNTGEHVTALGGSARFRDVVNDESGLKTFLADARARGSQPHARDGVERLREGRGEVDGQLATPNERKGNSQD